MTIHNVAKGEYLRLMRNNVEAEKYSGQVPLMQLILTVSKLSNLSFQFPYLQTCQ